jgi:hypothetical protein
MSVDDLPGITDIHEDAPEPKPEAQEKPLDKKQQPSPQQQIINNSFSNQIPAFKSQAIDAWSEYYDGLGVERKKDIERLSKLLEYEIELQPLYDDNNKLIKEDEKRVFRRRKITTKDYWYTEDLRVRIKMSKDPMEVKKLLLLLYKSMSFFYLEDKETGERMSEEQFMRCDWVPIKNICDGANLHSTMGTLPLEIGK